MATNNSNFDMNKYRAILATWNLIGQTLCCIEADNMDLSHNDKVREGLLRLTKPLRKYSIKMIDITSAKLDPLPDENGMVILPCSSRLLRVSLKKYLWKPLRLLLRKWKIPRKLRSSGISIA